MKIVKHYWFVAIALITMISFSSCESDEERGFDISGLYGKTWWGDMGFEDRYGEPLYSYITFTSGAFTDHGVGTEERCYHNDELYRVYKFDWEIQNGWLYLYYSDSYTFIIEYPSVSGRYFYGTAEDGFEIRFCLLYTSHTITQQRNILSMLFRQIFIIIVTAFFRTYTMNREST